MNTKTLVVFPYSGYDPSNPDGKLRERIFWKVVECCQLVDFEKNPLIVLNRDTERRDEGNRVRAFYNGLQEHKVDEKFILKVWSVDTCQMWLAGWGYILDNYQNQVDRIVQVPGDIDTVQDETTFFDNLEHFIGYTRNDLNIGDFSTGERFGAKDLIDQYGTYALLANWFPEITKKILGLPLRRPRSEFLNIDKQLLSKLLEKRKFAYEQTLNILILSWDFIKKDFKYRIKPFDLGELKDDASYRKYRDCLDQIERTERMLRLLWREIEGFTGNPAQEELINKYDRLDRRSTAIRENARIIIRNLLDIQV